MTVGKTLWKIIAIKVFIMFAVIRVFFFDTPEHKKLESEVQKADHFFTQISHKKNTK